MKRMIPCPKVIVMSSARMTASAERNAAWQAAAQDIYAQQQAQGAQPGADAGQSQSQANAGGAANGGDSAQPEDVEFEEVK